MSIIMSLSMSIIMSVEINFCSCCFGECQILLFTQYILISVRKFLLIN